MPFYFTDAEGAWSDSAKTTVRNKLAEFGRDTCVKLVEVDEDNPSDSGKFANTFRVLRSQGCMSYVGRHFQNQDIWLNGGCEHSYIPLHEFMHGLGWWHEQQRYITCLVLKTDSELVKNWTKLISFSLEVITVITSNSGLKDAT